MKKELSQMRRLFYFVFYGKFEFLHRLTVEGRIVCLCDALKHIADGKTLVPCFWRAEKRTRKAAAFRGKTDKTDLPSKSFSKSEILKTSLLFCTVLGKPVSPHTSQIGTAFYSLMPMHCKQKSASGNFPKALSFFVFSEQLNR